MSILKYHWSAIFNDGSKIFQFENGKENLFKNVLDRSKELKLFEIRHTEKPLSIGVNLERGFLFMHNQNEKTNYPSTDIKDKNNIRLIFFRRHFVTTNANDTIIYFIGYQYLDKNNRNHKVIIQLDELGNIVIGE